jgi:hypothetical protein
MLKAWEVDVRRSGAAISATVAMFLVGCGPGDPSVRYSGTTLAAHHPRDVKIYRATAPNQPFEEMGTIVVACPTDARQRPFGQVSIEGGCDFQSALEMAIEKAAQAGADAIFHIQTTAAANGDIVSMTAVTARFTGPPPEAPPAAAAASPAPKSTLEERLKRLKDLADQGLITPDEYAKRKAAILDQDL